MRKPDPRIAFRDADHVWRLMGCPACVLTGGYVRDRLLNRQSADLDFALEGDAELVAATAEILAAALCTRPHLLGKEPKWVWRVDGADVKVELWPRGELSLEDDILRRDLTVNAIVWRLPEHQFVDLVGGLDDLREHRVRAISRENLEDDPVRLLRVARFLAKLEDFELDSMTETWVRKLAPLLVSAPRERVGQELIGLLGTSGAARGVQAMIDLGLIVPAAPPDCAPEEVWLRRHGPAAGMLAGSGRRSGHPVPGAVAEAGAAAGIALLLRSWGISEQRQVAPYCWTRPTRLAAASAASLLDEMLVTVELAARERRELIAQAGTSFPAALALAAAVSMVNGGDPRPWRRWWQQWQRCGAELVTPTPLLPAEEIAALTGVEPGPELGRHIRRLLRAQVRGELRSPAGARRWLSASSR